MRTFLKIFTAAAIVAGATSPAFAKGGGGGWTSNPFLVKQAKAAAAEACAQHTDKCIGFGDKFYGQ